MGRPTFPPLTAWPALDAMQCLGEAALIAKTSQSTLERICNALAVNPRRRPKARKPQWVEVARLYADPRIGKAGTVQAGKIYLAMGMDIGLMHTVPLPEPKAKAKAKATRVKEQSAGPKTYGELLDVFRITIEKARRQDGPLPAQAIRDLYDRIAALGAPPQGVLGGKPFHRIGRFVSLGDFMAHATPEERWPFILPRKGTRPIDLQSAKPQDWRRGELALLTVEEWYAKRAEGLVVEVKFRGERHSKKTAVAVGKDTGKGTPRPDGKKWRSPRA